MYGSNPSRQLLSNLRILSRDSEVGIFLPLTIGLSTEGDIHGGSGVSSVAGEKLFRRPQCL